MKNKFFLFLALMPFILFILGYILSYFLIGSGLYQTPNLIGLRLSHALNLAAKNHATIKLLCEQEAPGVEPGIIMSQKPSSGRLIKQNQTILVTIAKEKQLTKAPDLKLHSLKDCIKIAKEHDIQLKNYPLIYPLGIDTCIGQIPEKNIILSDKKIIIYTAQQKPNLYTMPNFIGKNINLVINKLEQQQINYKIFESSEIIHPPFLKEMIIVNQKPKPGSFVTLNTSFTIQLEVK
jgi:beta-lactam-binding protein with PASTA domain